MRCERPPRGGDAPPPRRGRRGARPRAPPAGAAAPRPPPPRPAAPRRGGVGGGAPGGMRGLTPPTATLAFVDAIKIDCDDAFRCRASFPAGDAIFVQIYGNDDDVCFDAELAATDPYIDAVQASV